MTTANLPASPPASPRAALNEIDAAAKWPSVLFLSSALAWLLTGTLLALIASIKLHRPDFLAGCEWLTYGRVEAAAHSVFLYGWAANAAFLVGLWVMSRLSQAPLARPAVLLVAGGIWNLGVTVGLLGLLSGDGAGFPWLELPAYVTPILLVSYALIAVWGVLNFAQRRTELSFASQWYLLAAFFAFPWVYSVAIVMLFLAPVRGTVQSLVDAWYIHNMLALWLIPTALAALYYFVPKLTGKPVYDYYLARFGFWSLIFFYGAAGPIRLIGAPVPAWIQTIGTVASILMVLPLVIIVMNLFGTFAGRYHRLRGNPTLQFSLFGMVAFVLFVLQGLSLGLRDVSGVAQFTLYTWSHDALGLYAFFSMVMFGAIYFLLPRLLAKPWASARLIAAHFWLSALGIAIYVVGFALGGIQQGLAMRDAATPFLDILRLITPYLELGTAAWVLLALGHLAFAANFVCTLATPCAKSADQLFRTPPAMEIAAQ